jgi:hypothetical protein
MLSDLLRRPHVGGSLVLTVLIAGWSAACATPTPVTGDTTSQFAAAATSTPLNYPYALPSNWQAYQNPNTMPSSMPAGWPPANSGYSTTNYGSGPVNPADIGPSSYASSHPTTLPSAAASAIPAGININGQGMDVLGGFLGGDPSQGGSGGLLGGDPSQGTSVISPSASPMMNLNQSQPWVNGGFGFSNSSGWSF